MPDEIPVGATNYFVKVGENTDLAVSSATSAAVSAAVAEAVVGPNYANTTAGLTATTSGQSFAVDNGDGTVSIYRNVSGSAVLQRSIGTTAYNDGRFTQKTDLASTASGKGADFVANTIPVINANFYANLNAAITAALAVGRPVYLGGVGDVHIITDTLLINSPNLVIYGDGATVHMSHTVGFVKPMLRLQSGGVGFKSWGIKWDHNAVGVAGPAVANQVAIAFLDAIMLGADEFEFSGEVYNSSVNGVGIGSFTATGTGAGGSPLNATQTVGEPKAWRIGAVYGENCGCGNQNYAAHSEFGSKGAVVNVLTASDGTIGSVSGRDNYNGLIVDFAGGAEATIGPCQFSGTKRDATYPLNGSGIDYYFGSGGIVAPSLKSDGAERNGLVVSYAAGEVLIGAHVHAAGEEGAVISGGSVTGAIVISAASQTANNAKDAFWLDAGSANVKANLRITVVNAASGNKQRYSYASSHLGSYRVTGLIDLVADAGMTGTFNRSSIEQLNICGAQSRESYGVFGFGTGPIQDTTSRAFLGGDLTLINSQPAIIGRLVYDLGVGAWKHTSNGYGFVIKQDSTTGAITLQKSGNNSGGEGATATLTTVATW
jgi:hypothetical protein